MELNQKILENSPDWQAVLEVCRRLTSRGHKAYLAGGAVRDVLLGRIPHDFDIATEASVEEIESLFEKVVLVGKNFGVLKVLVGESEIEVAQFRKESDYKNGRHPSLVSAGTPQEDAQRRDLTINALFYDLQSGNLIDYVQGHEDLKKKTIRCVGVPDVRFQEDHLRLLRAIRFKNHLGFQYDAGTHQALIRHKDLVRDLSRERVQEELLKILSSKSAMSSVDDYYSLGFMHALFPDRALNYKDKKNEMEYIFSLPGNDDIHRLIGFFWQVRFYENIFDGLRLSRHDEKIMKDNFETLSHLEDFFQQRPGDQFLKLKNKYFFQSLLWMQEMEFRKISKIHAFSLQIQQIISDFRHRKLDQKWPEPLVVGDDLKSVLQGERLGSALKQAYAYQIETFQTDKIEILNYLRQTFGEI